MSRKKKRMERLQARRRYLIHQGGAQGWSGLTDERKMELDTLLQGYRVIAGELLRDVFGVACCIPATRVTVNVLAHFGFQARPLSVRADILNPAFQQALLSEGLQLHDVSEQWMAKHADVRCVCLGPGTDEERKAGVIHVVAIAENHWLIDASLGQANDTKEDVGIRMDHVVLSTVTENFLAGRNGLQLRDAVNGCRVHYTAFLDDQHFLQGPAWQHPAIPAVSAVLTEKLESVAVVVLPDGA